MRVIIAGSRGIDNYQLLLDAIEESGFDITHVISGHCYKGVDQLGERYANEKQLKLSRYPANWDLHGKKAGYLRNVEMANHAEALLAITNGSKGTAHMIKIATEKGLRVYIKHVRSK